MALVLSASSEDASAPTGAALVLTACILALVIGLASASAIAATVVAVLAFGRATSQRIASPRACAIACYATAYLPLAALPAIGAWVAVLGARAIARGMPREPTTATASVFGLALVATWILAMGLVVTPFIAIAMTLAG